MTEVLGDVLKIAPIADPPGRYMLRADTTTVRVNGGESNNPLTVNPRKVNTSQQTQFRGRALALMGPYSDANPHIDSHGHPNGENGQVLVNFTPTDWDGTKTRDLPSTLGCRADLNGSAFFIFDMPGNQVFHIRPDQLEIFDRHNYTGIPSSIWAPSFFSLGVTADLPKPTAAERGQIRRMEGGPGEADGVFICQKNADDEFYWDRIA